jgi:hypothetical protein
VHCGSKSAIAQTSSPLLPHHHHHHHPPPQRPCTQSAPHPLLHLHVAPLSPPPTLHTLQQAHPTAEMRKKSVASGAGCRHHTLDPDPVQRSPLVRSPNRRGLTGARVMIPSRRLVCDESGSEKRDGRDRGRGPIAPRASNSLRIMPPFFYSTSGLPPQLRHFLRIL